MSETSKWMGNIIKSVSPSYKAITEATFYRYELGTGDIRELTYEEMKRDYHEYDSFYSNTWEAKMWIGNALEFNGYIYGMSKELINRVVKERELLV